MSEKLGPGATLPERLLGGLGVDAHSHELAELETLLGWPFRDRRLLEVALTHRSFANERESGEHYERFEFLGDAVLGMVAAEWLFLRYPERPEGELSKEKAYFISEVALARHGEALGLGRWLRLGVGEERSGGRSKESILADVVEALLGAIYLDGGLGPARLLVWRLLEASAAWNRPAAGRDPKTALQELAQARGWELPAYEIVDERGPDHEKVFAILCTVDGRPLGRGEGRTKKAAEQAAAAAALGELGGAPAAAGGPERS